MAKNLGTTTIGTAVFPHVHAPDTKFNADGVYTTKLKLDGSEAEALKNKIDAAITESVAAAKKANPKKQIKQADAPYKPDLDSEGNETGATLFNFKLNAKGKRKDGTPFTQQPAVFDAKGKPLPKGTRVGGGSQIKVAYEIAPFYTAQVGAGVTLRLKAVQVIDLKTGGDAASYGFGEEEGYEAPEASEFAEQETPAAEAPAAESTQSASDF